MKKRITITAIAIIVIVVMATSLCACSSLSNYLKTVNIVTLTTDELSDNNVASAVAQTAVQSCVRVVSTFTLVGQSFTSSGSGFIITSDGYVITNRHVVALYIESQYKTTYSLKPTTSCKTLYSAGDVKIAFADGDAYECTIVAYSTDYNLDLAILKIQSKTGGASEFLPLSIDTSSTLFYGQTAYTFGNPENIGLIFTSLMISNPGLKLNSSTSYDSIILDGNINHGNSGGALIDDNIHVIGVIFARVESLSASDGENEVYGIGCAISSTDLVSYIKAVQTTQGITINYNEASDSEE